MVNKQLFFLFHLFFFWGLSASPQELMVSKKKIIVNEREAEIFSLCLEKGSFGLEFNKGQYFDVILKNSLNVPTSIHWHGIILPNRQDGVAFVTQFPLYPGNSYHYKYLLIQSGTYWMHSHYGLQEQKLLSAPLIILDPNESPLSNQEAVIFLTDFSFQSPSEIFQELKCRPQMKKMSGQKSEDLVDVNYDAFLINEKTIENPDFLKVTSGEKIRLRIINAASSTNFFIDIGELKGELIAVDGNRIQSYYDSNFEISVAQRLDIIVTIPDKKDFFPIFATGEGTDKQAVFILTTDENKQPVSLPPLTKKAGALNNSQEMQFRALYPLPKKPVDRKVMLELGGNMSKYEWTINAQSWPEVTPVIVEEGERVQITFKNLSTMSHPMHLHGHVFQVTEINGQELNGAVRDTVLVTPHSSVVIQFDANNPGVWPLHCHLLYHSNAGMFTVVKYKDFQQPL